MVGRGEGSLTSRRVSAAPHGSDEPDAVAMPMAAGGQPGLFAPGRRVLTSGIVLIITIVAFEALAVATILPLVEADLGDLHLYGWVFSAFFLGNLVGIVVAGQAADRMPLVLPFAGGAALFAAGLALAATAPSMLVLVLARALQGLGAGALPAVAYVCIGRAYPPEQRPRLFALLSTAWVLPSLVGPAAAGFVGEAIGWRWVFAGLLPLVLAFGAVVAGALRRIGSPDGGGAATVSVRDAVLVAGAGAAVLGGLGAEQWWLVTALVIGGLAVGLPAYRRLTPPGTLQLAEGLPAAIGLRGLLTFAFFAADAYVPFTLATARGVSPGVAGLALTAAALSWTAGSWIQARQVHRSGPRSLVRVGFAVLSGVTLAFATVLLPAVPPLVAFPLWGLGGFAMGVAYSPLSLTVLGFAPRGGEGTATAALQLADTLGVALGTGTSGAVIAWATAAGWDRSLGLVLVFASAAVVAALGAVLAARLPGRVPREEPVTG